MGVRCWLFVCGYLFTKDSINFEEITAEFWLGFNVLLDRTCNEKFKYETI